MARFSRDRVSNKLKRASRRLRRKGYTSQAGQMAMAAEQARLNEPTIYRPEHRIMENEASNLIAESQRLAAQDRKSTRLNSSHSQQSRMPSSA